MIPKRIQPFLKSTNTRSNGTNTLVEGTLICCNSSSFEIGVVGQIQRTMLSRMLLYPKNDRIILHVRCKQCGKLIVVFDSDIDGYNACRQAQNKNVSLTFADCCKCFSNNYSVNIKYEYPNEQELAELGESDVENLFTWIWISLVCNSCKKKHSNFVDYETS